MSNAAQFQTAAAARTAIFAGNSTFTLVSKRTGARYTYRVRVKDGDAERSPVHFASLLTGPDNTSDYTYVGIAAEKGVRLTKASRLGRDAAPVAALDWALRQLASSDTLPDTLEVWHTGRCARCGRVLTVPESVASGLGPECAERVAAG